jgi:hypothetical protein
MKKNNYINTSKICDFINSIYQTDNNLDDCWKEIR